MYNVLYMANEAVLIHELAPPIPFTVVDGTGIEKGAILKMTDPMTAIINSGANDLVAGIAAEEKIANDGKVKISVYRQGVFRVLAGGAVTVGDMVEIHSVVNEVVTATQTAAATANLLGQALETAADTDTFLVELSPITIKDPA